MKTVIGDCAERLCRLVVKSITFATLSLVVAGVASAGTWTPLVHRPAVNSIQLMVLMTDGSIMVHTFDDIQTWVRLTPDAKGSYVNGRWKTLGKMITPRLYFASQVLPDGRLWVMGGEYTGPFADPNWGPQAEIYDPLANKWTEAAGDPPQEGCGPVPVTSSVTLTAGSSLIKEIYSTYRILPGWAIAGTGIKADTTVVEVDSPTSLTMSAKATSSGPAVIQFVGEPNSCFGDDPSILVPKHNILVGNLLSRQTYLYSIAQNAFTPTAPKVYNDSSDEEGWSGLSSGKILNYDLFQSIATGTGYAETYNPATDLWKSISPADGTARGELPVLSDPQVGFELGPTLRLVDGRTLVIGANQHTAIYEPASNTWAPGPDMRADLVGPGGTIPKAKFGADDAPAAGLPNGHVFLIADPGPNPVSEGAQTQAGSAAVKVRSTAGMQATWSVAQADGKNTTIPAGAVIFSVDSPTSITLGTFDSSGNLVALKALQSNRDIGLVFGGIFSSPAQLFDFDPKVGSMIPIRGPAGSLLSTEAAFVTRMLVLPTGQLLLSDSSNQLYVYTPDGSPPESLRPEISGVKYNGKGVFALTGVRLNGQSAGAAYGDDDQMDEDYPIVRLHSPATGNVYYCRTTNWDSVSVDSQKTEKVDFTLNSAVTPGSYELTVVGAGIASRPVPIRIAKGEIEQMGEVAELPAEEGTDMSSPLALPSIKLTRVPMPIHRRQ
jgi:hypothetical protein